MCEYMFKLFDGTVRYFDLDMARDLVSQLVEIEQEIGIAVMVVELVA